MIMAWSSTIGGEYKMVKKLKINKVKPTSIVLTVLVVCMIAYMIVVRGNFFAGTFGHVVLEESKTIIDLNVKANEYVGLNGKQIIKVNQDGIIAYDLEGYELWSDTLSVKNYVVKQREPYVAVGSKQGNTIRLFDQKGARAEIICDNPILYFSVNENGGIAVIQSVADGHIIAGYDNKGKALSKKRITYESKDGYPTAVELSPDNDFLMASYLSVDEPVLTSTLIAIDMNKRNSEAVDDVEYGIAQKDNFIYEIEFIKNDTWVSIGDKQATWYDLSGKEVHSEKTISAVFTPYLHKMGTYGQGYFPVLSTESVNKNIIHRVDQLTYFDALGEQSFTMELAEPATYFYADAIGSIIGSGNRYTGYNKLGNQLFEYKGSVDVSKVYYLPDSRKGIAVTKEGVVLLKPKREGN